MHPNSISQKMVEPHSGPASNEPAPRRRHSPTLQLLFVLCTAITATALISHIAASAFGLPTGKAMYRRIGPAQGPQVFCAGSSLLQFGLSWPAVSATLGQGIENWGIG